MDSIDKRLLIELEGNCRLTHQAIADKLGLTRSAIKRRVDNLIKRRVIENFIVVLSRNMANYEWMSIDITTNESEDVEEFIARIEQYPLVFIIAWIRNGKYLVYCQVDSQLGMYDLGKFIRSHKEAVEVNLQPMLPVTNELLSPRSLYNINGKTKEFTNGQIIVLRSLFANARKSIAEISKETGFSSKRVKSILDELYASQAVHFTIQFNFSASGNTNLIFKLKFDEKKTEPREIVKWIQKHYSHEYWNSFLLVNEPILMNFFSCSELRDVERITTSLKRAHFTISAEPLILYPSKVMHNLPHQMMEYILKK